MHDELRAHVNFFDELRACIGDWPDEPHPAAVAVASVITRDAGSLAAGEAHTVALDAQS